MFLNCVEDLRTMFQNAIGIPPTQDQAEFHNKLQGAAFSHIPEQAAETGVCSLGNHAVAQSYSPTVTSQSNPSRC